MLDARRKALTSGRRLRRQEVEGDERGRGLLGQELHARRCGVEPLEQGIKVQSACAGDHDLAVDHTAFWK